MLHHKLKFTANAVGSLKFGFVIKTIKEEEEEVKVRVNFSDFRFSRSLFSCLVDVSHCSMSVFRRSNTTVGSWYGDLKGTPDLAAGKLEAWDCPCTLEEGTKEHIWTITFNISHMPKQNELMSLLDAISQFSSVTQSCLTLCNPMDCSRPGFPVHNQLLELLYSFKKKSSLIIHMVVANTVLEGKMRLQGNISSLSSVQSLSCV